jgi:hypothetical protein
VVTPLLPKSASRFQSRSIAKMSDAFFHLQNLAEGLLILAGSMEGEEDDPERLEPGAEFLEQEHRTDGRVAPGAPEVEDDDLAAVIREPAGPSDQAPHSDSAAGVPIARGLVRPRAACAASDRAWICATSGSGCSVIFSRRGPHGIEPRE